MGDAVLLGGELFEYLCDVHGPFLNLPDGLQVSAVAERLAAIWCAGLGRLGKSGGRVASSAIREDNRMDWKTIVNYVLLVGLFVAMVTMFNQVNGRLYSMRAENQRQHDAMQEVRRVFEGRITQLEEKAGIGPEDAE